MSETLNLGAGNWGVKDGSLLGYNSENGNFKPLPFNFERSTGATRVNKQGLIEVVSNNEPRIDFTNDSKGALLLEPERTNLIQYSEDFSNAYWTKGGVSETSGFISPDGTTSAYKLVESSLNELHYMNGGSLVISNGVDNALSIFAKYDGSNLAIRETGITGIYASFDLLNGVLLDSDGVDANITSLADDWYKIDLVYLSIDVGAIFQLFLLDETYTTGSPVISYQGDGTSGIYIFGAQFEQGSYATSYIPTQGSAVTRVAEECFNLPPTGIIGQTELTIFYQGIVERLGGSDGHALALSQSADASGSSRILLYRDSGNGNMYVYVQDTTTVFSTPLLVNSNPQINDKYAIAIKNNDLVIYCNGVKVAENTSGSVPISQYVYLNKWNNQINEKNIINEVKLYNQALTDAELISLTS